MGKNYVSLFLRTSTCVREEIALIAAFLKPTEHRLSGPDEKLLEIISLLEKADQTSNPIKAEEFYNKCWYELSLLQLTAQQAYIEHHLAEIDTLLKGVYPEAITMSLPDQLTHKSKLVAYQNNLPVIKKLLDSQYKFTAEDNAIYKEHKSDVEIRLGLVKLYLDDIKRHDKALKDQELEQELRIKEAKNGTLRKRIAIISLIVALLGISLTAYSIFYIQKPNTDKSNTGSKPNTADTTQRKQSLNSS